MPRDGTGTYNKAVSSVITNTTISSSGYNSQIDDMASALTDSLARDGQGGMTGNLDMNNNLIRELAAPALATDAANKAYVDGMFSGFRNLLINANPLINQRGYVSGAATSGANQYTLDRWRVVVSGQALSWTDSANVRTCTAPAGGVEQVIEGVSIIGGVHTLSWTGTAAATVNGSAVTNGAQVTLTGGSNATVRFSNGTFSLPQLEPGSAVTPFERRPRQVELALCQRYFLVFRSHQFGRNEVAAPGIYQMGIVFPVEMRDTPVVTFAASISTTGVTARALANTNARGVGVQVTTANGPINYGDTADYTADAEL